MIQHDGSFEQYVGIDADVQQHETPTDQEVIAAVVANQQGEEEGVQEAQDITVEDAQIPNVVLVRSSISTIRSFFEAQKVDTSEFLSILDKLDKGVDSFSNVKKTTILEFFTK